MIKTHLGLFEGIGGFSLAAKWMGWETLSWCEWNEFGQKVLRHHFPKAEGFGDITKTDFKKYANRIDILTGGFPCQPFSTAGKRKGTNDERYLWGEMLRAIQEVKPKYVIAENVFGITNIDGGLVFEQVCLDLEAEGYEVQPFIIPATAKNAPHRRDRVWFVAYRSQQRCDNRCDNRQERHIQATSERELSENKSERNRWQFGIGENGSVSSGIDSHPNSDGQHRCNCEHEINTSEGRIHAQCDIEQMGGDVANTNGIGRRENVSIRNGKSNVNDKIGSPGNQWENFPTQSPICGGDDGLPTKLDGITFPKWRTESIKAYGNAIVPQIAFELFKQLEKI